MVFGRASPVRIREEVCGDTLKRHPKPSPAPQAMSATVGKGGESQFLWALKQFPILRRRSGSDRPSEPVSPEEEVVPISLRESFRADPQADRDGRHRLGVPGRAGGTRRGSIDRAPAPSFPPPGGCGAGPESEW
jgi:hypothetical protein